MLEQKQHSSAQKTSNNAYKKQITLCTDVHENKLSYNDVQTFPKQRCFSGPPLGSMEGTAMYPHGPAPSVGDRNSS